MRAFRRYFLAPLIAAVAVLSVAGTGTAAHAAAPAGHASPTRLAPICPQGTNWDDILQACV